MSPLMFIGLDFKATLYTGNRGLCNFSGTICAFVKQNGVSVPLCVFPERVLDCANFIFVQLNMNRRAINLIRQCHRQRHGAEPTQAHLFRVSAHHHADVGVLCRIGRGSNRPHKQFQRHDRRQHHKGQQKAEQPLSFPHTFFHTQSPSKFKFRLYFGRGDPWGPLIPTRLPPIPQISAPSPAAAHVPALSAG